MVEHFRLESELVGLRVLRTEARERRVGNHGREARRPATLLEALGPACVGHHVGAEVVLNAELGIEDVPALAVRDCGEVPLVRGAGGDRPQG